MDPTDLVQIEAIKRLKYRYLRCLDQKRWDAIVDCFVPEATASYGGGSYEFEGRDAIVDFLRRSMGSEEFLSSHRCTHPEIDLTGPDTATGTWALDDFVIVGEHDVIVAGAAFYEDTYVMVDGDWLISHTGYRRTFEQVWPRSSLEGIQLTASWWSTGGRSELPAS